MQQIAAHWLFGKQHLGTQQVFEIKAALENGDGTNNALLHTVEALTTPEVMALTDMMAAETEAGCVCTTRGVLVEIIKNIWPVEVRDHMTAQDVRQFVEKYAAGGDERANIVQAWKDNQHAKETENEQPKIAAKPVATLPFRRCLLAQFLRNEPVSIADADLLKEIALAEMDTDNSYLQNLMLAAENAGEFKDKARDVDMAFLCEGIKAVWPVGDKRPDLNILMAFIRDWWETPYINRGLFVKSWRTGKPCGPIPMKTTDRGTNAGGLNKTDRGDLVEHSLDNLDIEIAAALLPMDFDIYAFPGGILRRCKEVVKAKEGPFFTWSGWLRETPGILDYSRAAIFALIRQARPDLHEFPSELVAYITQNLKETDHEHPSAETLAAARHLPTLPEAPEQEAEGVRQALENLGQTMQQLGQSCAGDAKQPEVKNIGGGMFTVEGLLTAQAVNAEKAGFIPANDENAETVCTGCGAVGGGHCPDCGAVMGDATYSAMEEGLKAEAEAEQQWEEMRDRAPVEENQETPEPDQNAPAPQQIEPETQQDEPAPALPAYFEPGRYEGIPNEVYHAANGISSSMIKDARVSLMYYHGRHVARSIEREETDALFFGTLVHALALEPEKFDEEYVVFPGVPAGAVSTSGEMKDIIERYNASMPPLLPADEIKRQIEAYNAALPAPLSLSANAEETAALYAALDPEYRAIPEGEKQTAGAMRECLKKFNATLPAPLKTSGSRDALLDQLATVDPEYVAAERAKPQPYNTSGNKDELKAVVRAINPQVIFADEFTAQWREANAQRQIVSPGEYALLRAMHAAVYEHPNAGKMLRHPGRATEVSYFGIDEGTGLEVRIRPDLELTINGRRIAMDLKTISAGKIKQAQLRAKLHREIIDRDYHVSAAMYCDVGDFDQFFWIFINKDKGHHWCAVVEASGDLLALGMLEYQQTISRISAALDSGEWSVPITDFTDDLNDFDARRLEALRQA
ncbi:PD-(D/E)XK nuclease-like domain-containing protein [Klebsiella pneumoniae]